MLTKTCPCGSEKPYASCCAPYHRGEKPKDALALMRSRFSAYALALVDYIVQTTAPNRRPKDLKQWKKEILFFAQNTRFEKLEIIDFTAEETKAFVTFKATLSQNQQDVSFTEKSTFEKLGDQWFYVSGQIFPKP